MQPENLYVLNGFVGRVVRRLHNSDICEFQYRDLHRCSTQVPFSLLIEYKEAK